MFYLKLRGGKNMVFLYLQVAVLSWGEETRLQAMFSPRTLGFDGFFYCHEEKETT
jgi:hypothetical protein